jgi:hypothetical protein
MSSLEIEIPALSKNVENTDPKTHTKAQDTPQHHHEANRNFTHSTIVFFIVGRGRIHQHKK